MPRSPVPRPRASRSETVIVVFRPSSSFFSADVRRNFRGECHPLYDSRLLKRTPQQKAHAYTHDKATTHTHLTHRTHKHHRKEKGGNSKVKSWRRGRTDMKRANVHTQLSFGGWRVRRANRGTCSRYVVTCVRNLHACHPFTTPTTGARCH